MAKFTKEEFINGLKEMTILEVKELVDAMKEEFGVDPSAVAVAAAPAAGAAAEENAAKTVVLKSAGGNKIAVIKILKEITGLGLVEAKALADNGGNVKENVPAEEANNIKAQLEEAGAEIELA
ncbi:MAG: 50S ribosomal protein L7/L12 [Clostridia bacterium]|nr:50S ribosomal protein L7/L12 [Clostridia bacterium]